jgi:hypothetical protein
MPTPPPPLPRANDAEAVGEEIHVHIEGRDVYQLPLLASGMELPTGPRFVVHVPAVKCTCAACDGSGIDGDCGDDGRAIDVKCAACNGSGGTAPATAAYAGATNIEVMREAFEKARPAVKKFHYQWDMSRQRYLLDGDEDRGQYMQNEFAEWCEAWCEALAAPAPAATAPAALTDEQIIERCRAVGIKWVPPELPDDCDHEIGFPGSFDMASMDEMRALLATNPRNSTDAGEGS